MMGLFQRLTDTLRGRSYIYAAQTTAPDTFVESDDHFTFQDYLAMRELAFEWADSYDCKDRKRLSKILAPNIHVDYTEVNGNEYASMPADQFVAFMFHPGFVGDPLVNTQHLLGASKFTQISPTEVHASYQIRAAHQRYTSTDRLTVENKGHGHAMITHEYVKIGGSWKFAGLRPEVRWNEFAFDKIFVNFDPSAIMRPSAQDLAKVTKSAMEVSEAFVQPGCVDVEVGLEHNASG